MTQGDEMSLKYEVPEQQQGTERDFINLSWNYHKPYLYALGDTIDPLPFNEMTQYPYDTKVENYPYQTNQSYINEYNTRHVNWTGLPTDIIPNQIHHSINTDYIDVEVTEGTPLPHQTSHVRSSGSSAAAIASFQNEQQQRAIDNNIENFNRDICPNISGTQSLIPTGLVIDGAHNCVTPQQCNVINGQLKQPLDVMIVIDKSGSMAGNKITQAKDAANAFIDNLVPGSDRVGYVNYSTKGTLINGLTTSVSTVKSNISSTVIDANTNIGGAIKTAFQEISDNARPEVKHVIVLLTDGEANISDTKGQTANQYAINQANIAKVDGTIIYTVGLGTSVDANLLKAIANLPSNYYYSPTGLDLSSIYLKIAAIECTALPAKIVETVKYDKNGNGIIDNGEGGLGGAVISLISKDGTQPTRTTTSEEDGTYTFDNITPGEYSICIAAPTGMYQTSPTSNACYDVTIVQGVNTPGVSFIVGGTAPAFCDLHPGDKSCINSQLCTLHPTDPSCTTQENKTPTTENTNTKNPSENTPTDNNQNNNTTNPPENTPTENNQNQNVDTTNPSENTTTENTQTQENNNSVTKSKCQGVDCIITAVLGATTLGDILTAIQDGTFNLFSGMYGGLYQITKTVIDVFNDPVGKAVTTTVATTGAATGIYYGVVNTAFSGPIAASEIILTPLRLWTLLLAALGFKKRKSPWGTVYDSTTKQPLDPAYVVLQDMEGKEIATSITDLDGRYGFLVPPGKYRIIANKTNYEFPSKKLAGQTKDALYDELYFNEIIEITEDGQVITKNIPMDAIKFDWNEFAKRDQKLMKFFSRREIWVAKLMDTLFTLGFIISIIASLINPVFYNILILSLYVIMFILKKTILKPRAYGHVKHKDTDAPLSFAILRFFYPNGDHEVIHKVTDMTGKYYCLIANGNYVTKIENKNPDESYTPVYTSETIEVDRGYINRRFDV
jgi:Mg-chelatase subunit ChlD